MRARLIEVVAGLILGLALFGAAAGATLMMKRVVGPGEREHHPGLVSGETTR